MNFSSDSSISFDDAVKAADKTMAEKNPKLRLLMKCMISHHIRPYAHFCYHYIRWVDDYIDNKSISLMDKKSFYREQIKLVTSFINGEVIHTNFVEELFLKCFIEFVHERNAHFLMEDLKLLLKTIGDDIRRQENGGILSQEEMQNYMNDTLKSFFVITNFFLHPKIVLQYRNDFIYLRTVAHIFLINDLAEDFELGYINLSSEDLQQYHIDSANLLTDKNLKIWFMDSFNEFQKWLDEDALTVKNFPFKLKLFWIWSFPYCVHKMNRIKIYDYNPRKDIPKSLIREIKLYLLTILSAIIYMFKIFLPSKFSSLAPRDGNNQS